MKNDSNTPSGKQHPSEYDADTLSLQRGGFRSDERLPGYHEFCRRVQVWGKIGVFCGGLGGIFFGGRLLTGFTGLNQFLQTGSMAVGIAGAVAGAIVVGGLSLLAVGMYSLVVARNRLLRLDNPRETDKIDNKEDPSRDNL